MSAESKSWIVVVASLLSGCVFQGLSLDPPQGSLLTSEVPRGGGHACYAAYVYQLSDDRRASLRGALDEVCRVFASDRFRERVARQELWLARTRCDLDGHSDQPVRVGSAFVLESVIDADVDPIHYLANDNVFSNATTDVVPNRTSIDPGRIDQWRSCDRTVRADLLNTLAHELTHLATFGEGPEWIRYRDDAPRTTCDERYLVSYRFGDMVECHYLYPADDRAFDACLDARRAVADPTACRADAERRAGACSAGSAR